MLRERSIVREACDTDRGPISWRIDKFALPLVAKVSLMSNVRLLQPPHRFVVRVSEVVRPDARDIQSLRS